MLAQPFFSSARAIPQARAPPLPLAPLSLSPSATLATALALVAASLASLPILSVSAHAWLSSFTSRLVVQRPGGSYPQQSGSSLCFFYSGSSSWPLHAVLRASAPS